MVVHSFSISDADLKYPRKLLKNKTLKTVKQGNSTFKYSN